MSRPEKFRRWLLAALALSALMAGPARAELKVGDAFPPFAAIEFEGKLPETGGKVVLVDFWASWCAPCKASFPAYAGLHADFASRGLVIVAVSVDQSAAAYAAFVKRMAPPFAVLRDKTQLFVQQVRVPAMPTCFLLGRDGRVRFVHQGFHGDVTARDLRKDIELLLSTSP